MPKIIKTSGDISGFWPITFLWEREVLNPLQSGPGGLGLVILKEMWWVKVLRCHQLFPFFFRFQKSLKFLMEVWYSSIYFSWALTCSAPPWVLGCCRAPSSLPEQTWPVTRGGGALRDQARQCTGSGSACGGCQWTVVCAWLLCGINETQQYIFSWWKIKLLYYPYIIIV